jgi:hypothetical protein
MTSSLLSNHIKETIVLQEQRFLINTVESSPFLRTFYSNTPNYYSNRPNPMNKNSQNSISQPLRLLGIRFTILRDLPPLSYNNSHLIILYLLSLPFLTTSSLFIQLLSLDILELDFNTQLSTCKMVFFLQRKFF